MTRAELTIAGVGGQGSILAGVILGSAVVTHAGRYAVQTQAYSAELRGGFAAAWVVVSDEPVVFPRVTKPDILVAQAQDSIDRFSEVLKPEGVLIVDSDLVPTVPAIMNAIYDAIGVRICSLPATPEKILAALREKKRGEQQRQAKPASEEPQTINEETTVA